MTQSATNTASEILDLVDDGDNVVGAIERKVASPQHLRELDRYIRVAELFIVNTLGQIWVPTRTMDKSIAPGGYDYSAAGHVESGDTYLETIIRETEEELNFNPTADELEHAAQIRYDDIRLFSAIYLHHSDDTPDYNPDDFNHGEWLSAQELTTNINNGHPAKSNLPTAISALTNYLSDGEVQNLSVVVDQ